MRSAARLALMLFFAAIAVGCSSDDEPQTVNFGGEATEEATSSETNTGSDSDVDLSQYYFDGTTRESLPADQNERFDIMYEWIERNIESNSGYSVGLSGTDLELEFSVDVQNSEEAAAQCDTYRDIAAAYLYDAELAEITLAGWVLGANGSFEEADWDKITCEI